MKDAKALTITFLTPVSFASLNGADKETDNMSNIKKITRGTLQYPYVSSQAIRRALREQIAVLGEKMSESQAATIAKGAATTACDPAKYIDDDLFGFMNAQKETVKRTAPSTRVPPCLAGPVSWRSRFRHQLHVGWERREPKYLRDRDPFRHLSRNIAPGTGPSGHWRPFHGEIGRRREKASTHQGPAEGCSEPLEQRTSDSSPCGYITQISCCRCS